MAIVSQLCISFPYVLHGLCADYLTCNIAYNAVMPLSSASTRGRYRRIEGVTALVLCEAFVMLVMLAEMLFAGPQSHHHLARVRWLVVGENLGCLVVVGDEPTMHPEQLASKDDQCR